MRVVYRDQTWQFNETLQVRKLLALVNLLPENVLVVRNGKLVTEDQYLKAGDEVKIVAVVSGG